MGGTTAKAALIENGEPAKTTEYEVGAGINLSSRLVKGGGHAVKLPFIDISEIGAGGGSIVAVDAVGSLKVAAANMTRAVKAVSTYRGRDPRDFVLMAFGGNGPVAAVEIARALQMKRVVVPPAPGVFSAFGLLCSDTEYLASRTIFRRMDEVTGDEIRAELFALEAQVRNSLAGDGVAVGAMTLLHFAELRYSGQAYELGVSVDPARPDLAAMAAAFDAEHARTYGHASPGAPADLVSLKVIGRSPAGMNAASLSRLAPEGEPPNSTRTAYFGAQLGRHETPVIGRQALTATPRPGPMIIEDYDATCVVPPDATAALDAHGNIDISIG